MPKSLRSLATMFMIGAALPGIAFAQSSAPRADPGKKACAQEARRLCPAEMKSLSRKKVEACMIVKIDQTSPVCRSAMLKIKAEREAVARRPARGQAATSE